MAITLESYQRVVLEQLFLNCPQIKKFAVVTRFDEFGIADATWIDHNDEFHKLPIDLSEDINQIVALAHTTLRMMYGNSFEGQEGRSS